jgi:hypothetical protein
VLSCVVTAVSAIAALYSSTYSVLCISTHHTALCSIYSTVTTKYCHRSAIALLAAVSAAIAYHLVLLPVSSTVVHVTTVNSHIKNASAMKILMISPLLPEIVL